MAANKGIGLDDIPAEVLRAGGEPLAQLVADLGAKIPATECWPVTYNSGRLIDLFKGQGDRKECDASRGLTLINHISKGLIADVKNEVEQKYTDIMARSQMGAVRGGGTDFAHHFLHLSLDFARARHLSIFFYGFGESI